MIIVRCIANNQYLPGTEYITGSAKYLVSLIFSMGCAIPDMIQHVTEK